MSLKQQVSSGSEVDEKISALVTNANAIRAIAAAVEGTLGPKGLDTMLVDQFGEVVITNDGVTILTLMEANHPAARMLINVAKAQQEEIGDGTTTATVMAGALVAAGVEQVSRGVPVARVIEGLRKGIKEGLAALEAQKLILEDLKDSRLYQVALVAGREHEDIAALVMEAAELIGRERLLDRNFKLADTITALENAVSQVFLGVIIDKEKMNQQMPERLKKVKVLILDDALEPEEIEEEALGTEAGFARYLALQEQHKENIRKIIDLNLGIGLVLTDRRIDDIAEEMLTDAGIMAVQRVAAKELQKAAEHTGARPLKRTGLKKSPEILQKALGYVDEVFNDKKSAQVWLRGGAGQNLASLILGASTAEVAEERKRIAKDAASAVQAAVQGGIVPGGGAAELAAVQEVEKARASVKGMAAYGFSCVSEALKRPMAQIIGNAGFNPLEKLEDVLAAQAESGLNSLALDCESGNVCDMRKLGIWDPLPVKKQALRAAGEIAEAILRIDTIIKKKDGANLQA